MKRAYSIEEAHDYLGVKRKAFDKHIRPLLPTPLRIGTTKVWERIDLDAAFDKYRDQRSGRPGEKGDQEWVRQPYLVSTRGKTNAGMSTSSTVGFDFDAMASKVLEQRKTGSSSR